MSGWRRTSDSGIMCRTYFLSIALDTRQAYPYSLPMPATNTTIAAALLAAFPVYEVKIHEPGLGGREYVTIRFQPTGRGIVSASFTDAGDKVVVRGWGGESKISNDVKVGCGPGLSSDDTGFRNDMSCL